MKRGAFEARFAAGPAEVRASQNLRARFFPGDRYGGDSYDRAFRHVLLHDAATGRLKGSFRILLLPSAAEIGRSCSAQFYDLRALTSYPGPVMEIGRFCVAPGPRAPDLLRLAWAFITRLVDAEAVTLLFGCGSFPGTDPARYASAFAYLRARHAAPPRWRPGIGSDAIVPFGTGRPYTASARAEIPPVLRSYLAMGGWVSGHAVIDPQMQTIHVFTGVEIASIPPARARLLRALAQPMPAA